MYIKFCRLLDKEDSLLIALVAITNEMHSKSSYSYCISNKDTTKLDLFKRPKLHIFPLFLLTSNLQCESSVQELYPDVHTIEPTCGLCVVLHVTL